MQKLDPKCYFFEQFLQALFFGLSIETPSLRRLIFELKTNASAKALELASIKFSTFKDGFSRFKAADFMRLYQYLLTTISWEKVGDKNLNGTGLLKVVDGSSFPLLKGMNWGTFRKTKNAFKIHIALNITTLCVTNFLLTAANASEREALVGFIEAAVTYIADRGYFSFALANLIQKSEAFFVFRLKRNYKIDVLEKLAITGIIPDCCLKVSDKLIRFRSNPLKTDAAIFRLVSFQVLKTHFIICTNRRDLTTLQIILLYVYRWQIELFFKFIKRSLNAIHLFCQSPNGATVYIYVILCFVLLQMALKQKSHNIVKKQHKETGLVVLEKEIPPPNFAFAADWVYEMGKIFKKLFKISADWLTYLKNSITQLLDYQVISNFAGL